MVRRAEAGSIREATSLIEKDHLPHLRMDYLQARNPAIDWGQIAKFSEKGASVFVFWGVYLN